MYLCQPLSLQSGPAVNSIHTVVGGGWEEPCAGLAFHKLEEETTVSMGPMPPGPSESRTSCPCLS